MATAKRRVIAPGVTMRRGLAIRIEAMIPYDTGDRQRAGGDAQFHVWPIIFFPTALAGLSSHPMIIGPPRYVVPESAVLLCHAANNQ